MYQEFGDDFEPVLKAAEPELQRVHERREAEAKRAHAREIASIKAADAAAERAHDLYAKGLWLGFALAVLMLTSSVLVGIFGPWWLSLLLAGPSLGSLVTVFVLRKNSDEATRLAARTHGALSAAAAPPP
ncbi:hypothetical protein [Streptodolium elevatio]|uniref:Uncharacterized protein n=1 Tax=Streptodolium elevatio TaxID=3157996 RepID=A0ABV3DMT3_9ACTN